MLFGRSFFVLYFIPAFSHQIQRDTFSCRNIFALVNDIDNQSEVFLFIDYWY